jgi:carbonic anhydrase/acetyltransferase-like protein (isoleucine patch superfamily)
MIHPSAFIHSEAVVLGDVHLGARASVWPTAVLRGDSDTITIGDESNVQDGAVIHADDGVPCTIGNRVTVGHRAIVHGATVEDECLIGMGAIVLNHAVIGRGSLIGAGAVVTEGMMVPPGSLVLGIPARRVMEVDDATRARILHGAAAYAELMERHKRGEFPRRVTA